MAQAQPVAVTPPASSPAAQNVGQAPKGPVAAIEPEKFFQVMEDKQVPRGASHYTLRAGKTISSRGYDIADLKRAGVKLEEVDAPGS